MTHSPQVAARAAHHYRIEKSHGDDGTRTTVRKLTPDERREEIARMLSGASVTEEARARPRGCSTQRDRLCCAAARHKPAGQDSLKMADLKAIADELGLEIRAHLHRERQPALRQRQARGRLEKGT